MIKTNVVGVNMTMRCNLNCKYCSLGIPRFRTANVPLEIDPEGLMMSLDELFQIYDYIRHIDFTGGEVFLWDMSTKGALADILKYCSKFKDKLGFGRILTNSTILPHDGLFETIANLDYDFDFLVDNYGNLSKKCSELKEKLDFYKIKYTEYKYFGEGQEFSGWVDIHNDYSKKDYTSEELRNMWKNCNLAHKSTARNLFNGKLYFCCTVLVLREACNIHYPDGHVNLFDKSISMQEKRSIVKSWNSGPPEYCKHCNGFYPTPENQPRITAGEQEQ